MALRYFFLILVCPTAMENDRPTQWTDAYMGNPKNDSIHMHAHTAAYNYYQRMQEYAAVLLAINITSLEYCCKFLHARLAIHAHVH